MKYYDTENDYIKRKESGATGWGQVSCFNNRLGVALAIHLLDGQVPKTVLDLGAGGGEDAISFARMGAIVTAVEQSFTATELIRSNVDKESVTKKVNVLQADLAEEINLKEECFDLIYSNSVIHCLTQKEDRAQFYKNIQKYCSKETIVYISTLVYPPCEKIKMRLNENQIQDGGNKKKRIFLTMEEIKNEISEFGFEMGRYCASKINYDLNEEDSELSFLMKLK